MKIITHFYRGRHFFSRLIQWRSFSPYSHVAIQIENVIYEAKEGKGVIKTIARENVPRSLADSLEIGLPHKETIEALAWLERRVGMGYDYLGVLLFLGRPRKAKKNHKYFCSELVTEFLEEFGIIEKQETSLSPGSLYLLIK